jgi:hypothetical protein
MRDALLTILAFIGILIVGFVLWLVMLPFLLVKAWQKVIRRKV